jgi:enoyl-CoA hydratase/carnithine racemase
MRGEHDRGGLRVLDATQEADIAVLRMSHGKVNALDIELCKHITRRLEELGTSAAQAVVLTGQAGIFSGISRDRGMCAANARIFPYVSFLRSAQLFSLLRTPETRD